MKTYRVNEIFYSLQGEGVRAGTANVFVRFSGCNMRCDMEAGEKSPGGFRCDTEFESGRAFEAGELFLEVQRIGGACRNIIFTGGEPTLQLDATLLLLFKTKDYYLAIETNGTNPVPDGIDWICVSPKVAEHALKQMTADEVKYVRHTGQGIPKPAIKAFHYLLSPAFDAGQLDPANLTWCINLVKENPSWRLSVQQHKNWLVR